jgi:NADH-quinone oxidoreductase subunit G
MGPIVKTAMTRCIHCTRCVRFAEEVAGVEEIGAIGRGEGMEITSYLEGAVHSELSGNVVDLCPVGALTSKPYAFEARPWELTKTLGIDVMDGVGTNIRIDSRGREVLRALPRVNDDVNEEWATDKTRHAIDGLMKRRLDKPYVRKNGKLEEASWNEAFQAIADVKAGSSVAAIAGDLVDCETMYAAKKLLKSMKSDMLEGRQTGLSYDVSSLSAVNFNSTIAGIEEADVILLVSTNPRWEASLVNTRIRKAVRQGGAKVFGIGPEADQTYPVEWLGDDMGLLAKLPKAAVDALKGAEKPAIILGGGALSVEGAHGAALKLATKYKLIRDGWNGFNVLHIGASRTGGLMLGYAFDGGIKAIAAKKPKLLFSLGADETDYSLFEGCYKVYIGHHGDAGAHAADVILPGAAYTEKNGTYVNLEGRVQRSNKAIFAPGDAREDWTILRALSDVMGKTLPFDSFAELRAKMAKDHPELAAEGLVTLEWSPPTGLPDKPKGQGVHPVKDFYLTNSIARASATMQRCSAELLHADDELMEAAE